MNFSTRKRDNKQSPEAVAKTRSWVTTMCPALTHSGARQFLHEHLSNQLVLLELPGNVSNAPAATRVVKNNALTNARHERPLLFAQELAIA
jgi:hypothetical protein